MCFRCLLMVMGLTAAGCAGPMGMQTAMAPGGLDSGGREKPVTDDPWVRDAGNFARAVHPAEPVRDPLGLRDFFTSEKAREIERNVGVGE